MKQSHKNRPWCVVNSRTDTIISRHKSESLAARKWKSLWGSISYGYDVKVEKRGGQ